MITRPTEVAEGRGSEHSARKFILEILGRILCSRLDLSREQADRRIVEFSELFFILCKSRNILRGHVQL